ncbi:NADH dehydrogenase (ubiquinone) 1 alpha subcomplex assembly factor 3 [Gammaproteobacteria bacterium]
MKFTLDSLAAAYVIRSYAPGQVIVNHQTYTSSLVVMPESLITDWPPQHFEDLSAPHFEDLAQYPLDVVLLGTGGRLRFPTPAVLAPLKERGIGVEVMGTGAACRTYNLLVAERRQVAAMLLMI